MKYLLFAVAVIYCSAAVGQRPLYWQPNSNWDNPENWNLGRRPCGGDVVSFKKVAALFTILMLPVSSFLCILLFYCPTHFNCLFLTYNSIIALTYNSIIVLTYNTIIALTYNTIIALTYNTIIALTYNSIIALTYNSIIALTYNSIIA